MMCFQQFFLIFALVTRYCYIWSAIVTLLIAATATTARAARLFHTKWAEESSALLLRKGKEYLFERRMPDSALVCYTIVANRWSSSLPQAEKRACLDGFLGKWQVYFLTYNDYREAFYSLYSAMDIAKDMGKEVPMIYYNFGTMYMDLSIQTRDSVSRDRAVSFFKKAFALACRQHNDRIIDHSFINLSIMAFDINRPGIIARQWEFIQKLPCTTKRSFRYCSRLLYHALAAQNEGEHQLAIAKYREIIMLLDDNFTNSRMRYMSYLGMANVYYGEKDYVKALQCLEEPERIAVKYGMNDARLQVYNNYATIYTKLNDKKKAEHYRIRYYDLKDTILNYQQTRSEGEMRFGYELEKSQDQIRAMKERHRVQTMITLVAVLVVAIVVFFLFLLFNKNRQLRRKNMVLYRRARGLVDHDNSVEEPEDEITLASDDSDGTPATTKHDDNEHKACSMSNEEMQDLGKRIKTVMDDTATICLPDFTAKRLAELVSARQRDVSTVIKVVHRSNFSRLLNEYRIKEAIRRMSQESKYGNLTIEGLANSVGIKSRTTFIASFKRVTGLTPSEYIKIEKSDKNR